MSAGAPEQNDVDVVQLVNRMILRAHHEGTSDIHIEPRTNRVRVRYRVDGVLVERPPIAVGLGGSIVSRLKVMSQLDIAQKRLPQDGAFEVRIGKLIVPIRLSSFPTEYGEKVVLRLLSTSRDVPDFASLGLSTINEKAFRRMVSHSEGMILVCGPTGAGKTTTIYAMLKELESTQRNIMTLEDPIEYRFDSIIQGQVYSKIGFDFASGLRSILRQDPDVILVGEMRDKETAEIALKASLTGHLVFSTLHTNGAVDTFVRLLDMGLERFVVASALRGIVSQRLVRKLCAGCAEKVPMNPATRQFFAIAEGEERFLFRAKGCSQCNNTGFSGRTAILEILEIDDELSDVMKSASLNRRELKQLIQQRGLKSLRHVGMDLVLQGVTSIDEIARVT